MNYDVQWAETAKQDLKKIAFWIAEREKNKEPARKLIKEIKARSKMLSEFPNIGTWPKDRVLKSNGYRYILYKHYLIFYLIDDVQSVVNIMAVFNEKQDYMRMMRQYV